MVLWAHIWSPLHVSFRIKPGFETVWSVRPYWRLLDHRSEEATGVWLKAARPGPVFLVSGCLCGEERPFKRIFHEIPDAAMSILNFRIAKNLPAVKDRLISPSLQIRDGTGEKMGKGSFPFGRSGECGVRDFSARKDCLTPAWSR